MAEGTFYTVIIPTFNRARLLPDAIESVFAQGVPDVQVIVIDDGSTDETREVVLGYGDRVEYAFQENQGSYSAKNHGLRLAKGDFISFLDSDDIWLPGKMKTEIELFEQMPEADAVVSDCEAWLEGDLSHPSWFKKNGVVLASAAPHFMPLHPPVWLKRSLFAMSCITIRRTALETMGAQPFDSWFRSHGDWDFEIRLLRLCRVLIVPRILSIIRRFDDGTRVDRATPGHTPTEAQARTALLRRLKVIEKALAMGGWPADAVSELTGARSEIIAQLG